MTVIQQQLSKKYFLYKTLTSLWFLSAVWLYFYRLFISDQQVGVLDGMAFAIGLVAEVPSGALADKFGRDRMVKIGQILAGGGLIIQALGSSFLPFFMGQTIMMIGVAFVSGADEALFFGQLNFKQNSTDWRKLVIKGSQFSLIASTLAVILGGWLHTINPRLPWILTGIAFISSAVLIWSLREVRLEHKKQSILLELKEQLQSIQEGFGQFLTPMLWPYVPIIIAVQGLFYTAGWGLLRLVLLDRFQFSPFLGSVAIASSGLITVAILAFMHKYADRMSEKKVLTLITLAAGAGLLLAIPNIGLWGFFVILALYAGEHILHPFMSEVLNYRAKENQRATVLSVASFLRTLPYVALAPIIGYLNTHNQLEYFLVGWTGVMLASIAIYLSQKKKDILVKIPDENEVTTDDRIPEIDATE